MKKITQQAVESFRNLKPYKSNNTEIKLIAFERGKPCIIGFYLFDNCIATLHTNERIKKLYITNCGWKSNTTKERLNGILNAYKLPLIYQKNFVWYIGEGEQFKGNKIFEL